MKITGLIWLEDLVDKIARKYAVKPSEVREVFKNRPRFHLLKRDTAGERMYTQLWGKQTRAGI